MILVQLNPKECLLVANDNSADASKLRHTLSRSNILVTERKRSKSDKQCLPTGVTMGIVFLL